MISEIGYTLILGKPIIFYLGILTYIFLLLTIILVLLTKKGIKNIPINYHRWAGYLTVIIATIHGLLGLSIYLGF